MTHDKKQPGLPVVEVDQAFPLMTTDGVSRPAASTGGAGDQGPAVTAAIRDVLGWRPRAQDPKAFAAALKASFQLSVVEDHVVARYVPRGVAVQADLGGVTGGQASLYLRARAAHEQITRMLDSLQPLRTDADPQDCEAYRGLVRDSVRRVVMELGREGGPRVAVVDSAFSVLTGYRPTPAPAPPVKVGLAAPALGGGLMGAFASGNSVGGGRSPLVPLAGAETDPDSVPGQLGALRDRFGLDDDHVNTVDEEKQRTSFWTLVELVTDIQRSWDSRRLDFTLAAGSGFLGTDLVQISRLLAAAAEQVDEFEAVLDSVLVSGAERQTVTLDRDTGLTLDDLVQWMRVFFTEDGPNIIRDAGRDGLVSSFTPTAVAILLTLRDKLVRRVVPCGGASCAGGCHCGARGKTACIPLGCCTPLPPGMYAGRVKIAVSTLCGLVQRLTAKAIRIGRFAGVVLLDLSVTPFETGSRFVRVDVRGLHVRPTYLPAFVVGPNPASLGSLVLPLQGSASADQDGMSAIFDVDALPAALGNLLTAAPDGVLLAASEVPLAVVDGELGRVVQGPGAVTWPRLRPTADVDVDGAPDSWDSIPSNQRFVPQTPPDPVPAAAPEDDCVEACDDCDCEEVALAEETSQPVLQEPVPVEPVLVEPVLHEPLPPEPVLVEPVLVEPVLHEPLPPEPVLVEPVLVEPVPVEAVLVEPVLPEPVLVEPVLVEPLPPEPAAAAGAADAPAAVTEVMADRWLAERVAAAVAEVEAEAAVRAELRQQAAAERIRWAEERANDAEARLADESARAALLAEAAARRDDLADRLRAAYQEAHDEDPALTAEQFARRGTAKALVQDAVDTAGADRKGK